MLCTYTIKGHIAKFINDHHVTFFDMPFKSENRLFLSGFDIGVDKFSSGKEPHLIPASASFSAEYAMNLQGKEEGFTLARVT